MNEFSHLRTLFIGFGSTDLWNTQLEHCLCLPTGTDFTWKWYEDTHLADMATFLSGCQIGQCAEINLVLSSQMTAAIASLPIPVFQFYVNISYLIISITQDKRVLASYIIDVPYVYIEQSQWPPEELLQHRLFPRTSSIDVRTEAHYVLVTSDLHEPLDAMILAETPTLDMHRMLRITLKS
jgi:hypothetical protein